MPPKRDTAKSVMTAMQRFLASLCAQSDRSAAPRSPTADKQYNAAKRLIARARALQAR